MLGKCLLSECLTIFQAGAGLWPLRRKDDLNDRKMRAQVQRQPLSSGLRCSLGGSGGAANQLPWDSAPACPSALPTASAHPNFWCCSAGLCAELVVRFTCVRVGCGTEHRGREAPAVVGAGAGGAVQQGPGSKSCLRLARPLSRGQGAC